MINRICFLSILMVFLCTTIKGQLSEPGTPPSFDFKLEKAVPVMEMGDVDIPALMAEDEEDLKSNLPLRFAYGFEVDYSMKNSGVWENLPNGGRVWRLTISCPDALNINFLYSDFYLAQGAEFYVYNSDHTQILGAFTSKNNKLTRRFATALIHDEVATLEYYEPPKVKEKGSIEIHQVAHGYRYLDGTTREEKAGPCQVNVNCPEGDNWQDEKKGVARIVMDGLYLCSGTLVNNTANDCKPYFSTANHCIDGGIKQDAVINPDVSGYIFYWNYEYPDCSSSGNLPEQTTNGGTVVANTFATGQHTLLGSDFALLLLAENPRDQYDVYFNGWDASGAQGNGGVGIHHPAGDDKKISTHSSVPVSSGYFWDLYWDPTPNGYSVTEGGSSGSPLFRENGLVIGQLFGGSSVNCDDPANDLGKYGKFSYSWENEDDLLGSPSTRRLDIWLDPVGGGTIKVLEGAYDPCEIPKVYFTNTSQSVEEASQVSDGCLGYREITVDLAITPYPSEVVTAEIFSDGSAENGTAGDYLIYPQTVTFNGVTNSNTVTVRIFDDAYVETTETIELGVALSALNGLEVGMLPDLSSHTINISSDDIPPTTHVQSVRNEVNPTTEYLGPHGTVHFFDLGSDGIMLTLENMTGEDLGCTTVFVDNAGASANNNWENGSTTGKTLRVLSDNPSTQALVKATLYYTESEIQGWEWFNAQGDDREDLVVLAFPGAVVPANEGMGLRLQTQAGSYLSDHSFTAVYSGIYSGFTIGNLDIAQQGQGNIILPNNSGGVATADWNLQAAPNPVKDRLSISWSSKENISGQLKIIDILGQVYYSENFTEINFQNKELLTNNLLPGIYLIQVIDNRGRSKVRKVVKK